MAHVSGGGGRWSMLSGDVQGVKWTRTELLLRRDTPWAALLKLARQEGSLVNLKRLKKQTGEKTEPKNWGKQNRAAVSYWTR